MNAVDSDRSTNYSFDVGQFTRPRQESNLGGDFFWLDDSPRVRHTTYGFSRRELSDKLFAPAHTFYQGPYLMRDRSGLDRQPCDEQAMPYATVGVSAIGHHGGPDIVRRAEAAIRPTLPCFTSGKDTTASYLTQSRQRRNPDDRVGMAERLSVVTVDRVWWLNVHQN